MASYVYNAEFQERAVIKMIKVSDLVYSYLKYGKSESETVKIKALDNVNMDIKDGEFIAIIGHNGSGKSTLAKHFNGLLSPESGSIWIDDKSTSEIQNLRDIRKKVCMVFQNPDNQIVGSTVEEDIAFGLENMQVPTEDMQKRIDVSLDAVNMMNKKNVSPKNLSGGQKQKTAIAGAIAVSPKCLVLDEATAMLDPKARLDVIKIAKYLNKTENMTIILITHFMEEIVDADKVFVMNKGKVVLSGKPEEVFSHTEILSEYHLELPPVTQLAISLKNKGLPIKLPVLKKEDLINQIEKIFRSVQI